jgi:hypothetical protein
MNLPDNCAILIFAYGVENEEADFSDFMERLLHKFRDFWTVK